MGGIQSGSGSGGGTRGKDINEIAQEYSVHPVLVGQWKKKILEQAATLFEGKRGPKPKDIHESEDRLYGKIRRLFGVPGL